MLEQLSRFGRDPFLQGVNSSHSGNINVRCGDVSSSPGAAPSSPAWYGETSWKPACARTTAASLRPPRRSSIRRAVYLQTSAPAAVHAYPPFALVPATLEDEIVPVSIKSVNCSKNAPVIGAGLAVGSGEVAKKLPPLPRDHKAAVVRGYGSFAAGHMLEGALRWTSSPEASCETPYLPRQLSPRGEKEEGATW